MSFGLKLGQLIIKLVFVIASVGLLITMVTVVLNVGGRGLFASPLLGTVEIVGMAGLLLVPFALVVTERNRAHIVVRMLVSRFSQRLQSLFVYFYFHPQPGCSRSAGLGWCFTDLGFDRQTGHGDARASCSQGSPYIHFGGRLPLSFWNSSETFN